VAGANGLFAVVALIGSSSFRLLIPITETSVTGLLQIDSEKRDHVPWLAGGI
jgi:hypothetical protein